MTAAWMSGGGLLMLAVGLVVAGCAVQGGRWLRHGLALAGALGLADALLQQRGLPIAALAALLLLLNLMAIFRLSGRGRGMGDEALAFHARHLSRLSPAQAQLLIDQGTFIEARAGEVLTREGEPVESLHFLVSGFAAVLVDNAIIGRVGPGDLIGEACLLADPRASATVRLADDHCRLWFIPKERLVPFLAAQPQIAAELNAATMGALRDKLERVNRERAGD